MICLLLTPGCAQKDGIVGKWHGTLGSAPSASATVDVEYKTDGTANSVIKSPQQEMAMQSTYTLQGDVLTETVTGVSVNQQKLPIPATAKTTETRRVRISGDTLTYTDSRRPGHLTLTRVP